MRLFRSLTSAQLLFYIFIKYLNELQRLLIQSSGDNNMGKYARIFGWQGLNSVNIILVVLLLKHFGGK